MQRALIPKLALTAAVLTALALVCLLQISTREIKSAADARHGQVYLTFLQEVERVKATLNQDKTAQPGLPGAPYWQALRETRRRFSAEHLDLVLAGAPVADGQLEALTELKGKPRDWEVTSLLDSSVRTFFKLPTKNLAALEVSSSVAFELEAWRSALTSLGAVLFILFFTSAWLWSSGRQTSDAPARRNAAFESELASRVSAIQKLGTELGTGLADVSAALAALEQAKDNRTASELAGQIRLLSINGAIEASRSGDNHRAFHEVFQELNRLATRLTEDLGAQHGAETVTRLQSRIAELRSRVSGEEAADRPASSSASSSKSGGSTSFRRVG